MQVLEKVAKAISRNYGVQVYFRGSEAYTNGKTIVLPTLPDDLDENDEAKVRGYCDHEIGHVVYTDMPTYKGYARKGRKQANVLNLLEDLWIEKMQGRDYPGAHVNMERTANLLHAETVAEKGMAAANEHVLNRVWLEGRRQNCGMRFPDPDMTASVKKVLGADFFERLAKVDSTAKCVELAKHVIDKVDEFDEKQQDNDLSDDGDESSESEQGQGDEGEQGESEESEGQDDDSDGDSEGDDSEGDDSDGDAEGEGYDGDSDEMRDGSDAKGDTDASELEGDDEDGDGEGFEGDSASQSNGDIEGDEGETPSGEAIEGDDEQQFGPEEANTLNTDLEDFEDDLDKLKDEIERKHDDALRGREYMPFSTEGDMVITIEDYIKKKGGRGRYERYSWTDNTRTFDRLKRELGPLNTIKAKICNLFNTRVASKWICDREQGKINNRVLARVKTGNRNVFREKYVSRETDTAISFLVDFSGSMSGSRLKSAMQAVIMFLETLQATKIKSEVLGYTTDGMCKGAVRGNYGRVENLVTYIIKDFNEPYNTKVKKRISNYQNVTLSQNCDPDNVKIAYDRLKARPERRKILFVLSDGEVANMGNTGLGIKYYRKLAKKIEREGIVEPIGVGLMCDAIKEFWTQTISINTSGTALAKGLFGELRKIFKV